MPRKTDRRERRPLDGRSAEAARRAARLFVRQANLGYVVMQNARVTPELRAFAIEIFNLIKVDDGYGYELYAPRID